MQTAILETNGTEYKGVATHGLGIFNVDGEWRIYHLSSGCYFIHFNHREQAIKFLTIAKDMIDWTQDKETMIKLWNGVLDEYQAAVAVANKA